MTTWMEHLTLHAQHSMHPTNMAAHHVTCSKAKQTQHMAPQAMPPNMDKPRAATQHRVCNTKA